MSRVLDTAVGLIFVFALAALFCSALVESISTMFERRAKYLITALRNMLDEAESGSSTEPGQRTPGLKPAKLHRLVKTYEGAKEVADGLDVRLKQHAAHAVAVRRKQAIAAPHWLARWRVNVPKAPKGGAYGPITATIFLHPMIRGLQTRRVFPGRDGRVRNPQYIPAATFARVLISTFLPDGAAPGDPDVVRDLRAVVAKLPESLQIRTSLLTLIDQAGDNIRVLQKSIEEWYDAQMGRVSGWYKRWTRLVLVVIGVLFAIALNVDTLQIGHTLWVNEPVRQAVVQASADGTLCVPASNEETATDDGATEGDAGDPAPADTGDDGTGDDDGGGTAQSVEDCVVETLSELQVAGVPLGHPAGCAPHRGHWAECTATAFAPANSFWAAMAKIAGWAITAGAISFGAPFWFDALSKLGSLRSSGPKPPAEETT
jgi:hypothetical protein